MSDIKIIDYPAKQNRTARLEAAYASIVENDGPKYNADAEEQHQWLMEEFTEWVSCCVPSFPKTGYLYYRYFDRAFSFYIDHRDSPMFIQFLADIIQAGFSYR